MLYQKIKNCGSRESNDSERKKTSAYSQSGLQELGLSTVEMGVY